MRINRLVILLGAFTTLLCILFSIIIGQYLRGKLMQRNVRTELDILVNNVVPLPAEFEIIETISLDSLYFTETFGKECFYARDYLILGSTLPASDALDAYARSLLSSGWITETRSYPTSRTLIYGENVRTVVEGGRPGVDVRNAIDYAELQRIYESIIFVRIDYAIPRRDGC